VSAPESSLGSPGSALRLVDLLLEEQQSLSAVERFSQRHEVDDLPLQARYYRDLIPSDRPGVGQQLAFRVDLDRCTGCKACVTACHSLNGLDPGETWRDIGGLVGEVAGLAYQQTVPSACHHCEDPGCLAGCPVQAYAKDPETGIVRHLDDQCIGCQYCVLKCPYDVPKYNPARGIVRKCDLCSGRLAVGEAPACVQGCPNQAISIEIVDTAVPRVERLLPVEAGAMPSSRITRPTTRYVGSRSGLGRVRPADTRLAPRVEAHTPLVLMMISIQLSVGLLGVDFVSGLLAPGSASSLRPVWAVLAAAVGIAGQAGAFLHLGRPLYAFRAFLGWRTSWMSREILVLGPFAGLVAAYAASLWLGPLFLESGSPVAWVPILQRGLCAGALVVGALATFCSVMIYADTHRPFWSLGRSSFRFFGSVVVLGSAGSLFCATDAALFGARVPEALVDGLGMLGVAAILAKLCAELSDLRCRGDLTASALERSARLMRGALRRELQLRIATAVAGLSLLLLLLALPRGAGPVIAGLASASFALLLIGELLERHLFFRAEAAPAMPGMVGTGFEGTDGGWT